MGLTKTCVEAESKYATKKPKKTQSDRETVIYIKAQMKLMTETSMQWPKKDCIINKVEILVEKYKP